MRTHAGASGMAAEASATEDLQTVYRCHHAWLVALLRRRLGDVDHAADLAQETFARILANRNTAPLREPRAYLTTVATRLTAQHFRRLSLERAYLEALANLPEPRSPSPEERLLIIEALNAVSRVLDALPARVREIFLLSQLDGLTYPVIAGRMGVSVNVVQKAMVRAYQHCYAVLYG